MAKSKDDVKYGTAQARLSEDDALRVAYKSGTPLEGGKIADSEPVDLFSSAHNVQKSTADQSQLRRDAAGEEEGGPEPNTGSAKFPSKNAPSLATK